MGEEAGQQAEAAAPEAPKPTGSKNTWDKFVLIMPSVLTFVIGVMGAVLTLQKQKEDVHQTAVVHQDDARQKDQQIRLEAERDTASRTISDTEMMVKLFPYLSSSDPVKQAFGYAMFASLHHEDIAIRLATLTRQKAGIGVVRALAASGDPGVRAAARDALARFENTTEAGGMTLGNRSSCKEFVASGFRFPAMRPATEQDYAEVAQGLGIEPAAFHAFVDAESAGKGFLGDGRPIILFERHIFHRLTNGKWDTTNPDVSAPVAGGYGTPGGNQYKRLTAAAALDCPAALEATSWGAFQILGSLSASAGYQHPDDFVRAQMSSGRAQLDAAAHLIEANGLVRYLRAKDWAGLARRWNGPNYQANGYDRHLAEAYIRHGGTGTNAPNAAATPAPTP